MGTRKRKSTRQSVGREVSDAHDEIPNTAVPVVGRRVFIKLATLLLGTGSVFDISEVLLAETRDEENKWPRYILSRTSDNLFIELLALGYKEKRFLGARWLSPAGGAVEPLLVFTFPPQHFAETAIPTAGIPPIFDDRMLSLVELLESKPSQLVFKDLAKRKLCLSLKDLLNWDELELVLPSMDAAGNDVRSEPKYSLEVAPSQSSPASRIEMPWGVELIPSVQTGRGFIATEYLWKHSNSAQSSGGWTVLWTTSLTRRGGGPLAMEVLSVRGFDQMSSTGTVDAGNLKITYKDKQGEVFPRGSTPNPDYATPLSNYDRIAIAASLSKRFPYTGRPSPTPVESALIQYVPTNTCVSACYVDGRTIPVEQFRLSALGGWLQLNGQWVAAPGCGLTGWVNSTSVGRDHHVEVISAGFLYPFGTACQLVVLSERVFVRDANRHYVAVLVKQAFLQIPEGNEVEVGHKETPFVTLSITTKLSPPLDLPSSGDPSTYSEYDFFLPTVNKRPFPFEHVGTDWSGNKHSSMMAMYYVSNKARSANGLIWEPGYPWDHTQKDAICGKNQDGNPDLYHTIPKSGDDGLRVLDKLWNEDGFRFAKYNRALVALATPLSRGDTSQRIDWVEWGRTNIGNLEPDHVVTPPFKPRARTIRFSIESMGLMSGQHTGLIGTYRDTRATSVPVLDPEPTASMELYFRNVQPGANMASSPYLYLLETRPLIGESGVVQKISTQEQAALIRESYYGTSSGRIPDSLFTEITNEIRFGASSGAEGVGGISVPDTHVSTLTRNYGPVGDATFNERRWIGYQNKKSALEAIGRLDFTAFRRTYRKLIDIAPFDPLRSEPDLEVMAQNARTLMGYSTSPRLLASSAAGLPSGGLKLGDLFGMDAQILPGISFADIFRNIAFGDSPDLPLELSESGPRTAQPLAWDVRVTGIDTLLSFVGREPGQLSLPEILSLLAMDAQLSDVAEPISAGIEASLNWSNDIFSQEKIGPVVFTPTSGTRLEIEALSRIDLGKITIAPDLKQLAFEPGKSQVSAKAKLSDFKITMFEAIEVSFSNVSFELLPDGRKDFVTNISEVQLIGPLSFISQLSEIFGGLGNDQGIKLDLSPERARISQTLRFPATEGQPLFIGPAQVINLALGWFVMIPLRGRDVLSVGFSVSSREKPLTIYVPPWYGGKAHVLLELTTRGCRLIEVSMEYGALIPVTWTLASGMASITAGIFYMCEQTVDSGRVVLKAFVKAAANLTVAGLIDFSGLIYIALSSDEKAGHKVLLGESTVSVSIKIGFVRISYSFTAYHTETSGGASAFVATENMAPNTPTLSLSASPNRVAIDVFGVHFDDARRAAFDRIIDGYAL